MEIANESFAIKDVNVSLHDHEHIELFVCLDQRLVAAKVVDQYVPNVAFGISVYKGRVLECLARSVSNFYLRSSKVEFK